MAELDPGVLASVINSNFKVVAESPAVAMAGHNERLQILAEKSLSKSIESMDTIQVTEGLGLAAAQRGDLSKQIADLGMVISGLQQMVKTAQTTPPVTP
jgi:hypothetical protein